MPGLFGFLGGAQIHTIDHKAFTEVSGKVTNYWCDEYCQLLLKAPEYNVANSSSDLDNIRIDIYGDIYSVNSVITTEEELHSQLTKHYLNNELNTFLESINGCFVLSLFDKRKQLLLLASDRIGLKPLHVWIVKDKILGFASEIKCIILNEYSELELDKVAINAFLDVGHYLGDQTMFKAIKRVGPATLIEINTLTQEYKENKYWGWSHIKKRTNISFETAVDKLYFHFDNAMKRCLSVMSQQSIAITLSGGLDSRVLLASARQHFCGNIDTFTFGNPDCDDALIAAQVSEVAGTTNHLRIIDELNWFNGRTDGVWLTDGLKNILHMHALGSVTDISKKSNYLLNGYLGDAVLGGSYLFRGINDQQIDEGLIKQRFGQHSAETLYQDPYFDFLGTDPLLIYNRGVRFISAGTELLSHKLNSLLPFMDNDLLEFAYSLPDHYRRRGWLYNNMLLKYFPDYFLNIPHQSTGKAIEAFPPKQIEKPIRVKQNSPLGLKQHLFNAIKMTPFEGIARKLHSKFSPKQEVNKSYVNYSQWLRTPEFKNRIVKMLLEPTSAVCIVFSREKVESIINDFYNTGQNVRPEKIGSLLTIEVYLKQLAEKGIDINF